MANSHGPLCLCKRCKMAMGFLPDTPRRNQRSERRSEAPYVERGGGNPCEACEGTGVCRRCEGTSWFTLRNGTKVRCKACEPRGPRASEADRGKCWPCHGRGTERPTLHRRDT
jgi:DnaJ-class molecular chaperone